ncbi:response regulator [Oceanobacillus longus]|uniref:Response regulator n=1 Tax=Oceanobacillus longus TaxID=930120 RepID=A0ABV8GXX3_9BACI
MYKVMLVDDDYPVLEFLNQAIPWAELGFHVTSLCQDGEKAFHIVQEEGAPDVIITDIGMPFMNGIELIKNVREINHNFESVFLTCHDDFSMAQEAIRLHSFDYILKESIDIDNMIKLLTRLKEKLDKVKQSSQETNWMIRENIKSLRNRTLEVLLNGNEKDIKDWFHQHKDEFYQKNCVPVLCFIDHYQRQKSYFTSSSLLKFAIDNLISEVLNKAGNSFTVAYKDSMFFILYFPETKNESLSLEVVRHSIKEINAILKRFLKVSLTTITGSITVFPYELSSELKFLTNNIDQRFYMNHGSIGRIGKEPFTVENIFVDYTDASEEIKLFIVQGNEGALEDAIKGWMGIFKVKQYDPQLVKSWTAHLILDMERMTHSMINDESSILSIINKKISDTETIEQLEYLFIANLKSMMRKLEEGQGVSTRPEILRAQKYVLMNLDKKITLGDVAVYLHMNPSYFSRMYKKDTNENFIDFVNRTKMERAKEIIVSTNKSIETIAYMLGFENKSYFLKIFKKYFGVVPNYYKLGTTKDHGDRNPGPLPVNQVF